MLTRRNFITFLSAWGTASSACWTSRAWAACPFPASHDGQHDVLMLNASCKDQESPTPNVFEPAILRVNAGDRVRFIPSQSGHNSASKRGMIPKGSQPWNSAIDEELTITLTVPGIYGYICLPHYEMGMVGLIIVDDDLSNLAEAKKARHPGSARKIFRAMLRSLEA